MNKIWIEVILHKSVIIQVAYWPERKKSDSNSSMRLEEEEFKKSTQEPISNRLLVHQQDYQMYARTRKTDRQKSN